MLPGNELCNPQTHYFPYNDIKTPGVSKNYVEDPENQMTFGGWESYYMQNGYPLFSMMDQFTMPITNETSFPSPPSAELYYGSLVNSSSLLHSLPASPPSTGTRSIRVELIAKTWLELRAKGEIEMLTTISGRRLFPSLRFRVEGLDPNATYTIGLRLRRVSGELQYSKTAKKSRKIGWREKRRSDGEEEDVPAETNEIFSVMQSGIELLQKGIDLEKAKLYASGSKVVKENSKMILAHSQRKYVPVIRILEHTIVEGPLNEVWSGSFADAAFVVVTQYKNEKIKMSKTIKNKYARGDIRVQAKSRQEDVDDVVQLTFNY